VNLPNIGIIGFGFIGRAVAHGFSLHANLKIYDKYDNEYDTLEETVNESDFLFVGVPTPMDDDGVQDLSYLDDAIANIDRVAKGNKFVIIKSTVLPGTARNYARKFRKLIFVSNPEFLTQRTYKLDFINPARIILGGVGSATYNVEHMYRVRFPQSNIFHTSWEGAETVKYISNCFFAVKVSFCNEMYDVANKIGVDYEELRDMWLADGRVGNSHHDVPGHDGDRGWGGKCYHKDVNAFIRWAEKNDVGVDTIIGADQTNKRVRTNKDWMEIQGATSKCAYGETKCQE